MPSSSTSRTPSASPGRATGETQIEILYNQAVQSFVRKDHVKTQATLEKILSILKNQSMPKTAWWDVDAVDSARVSNTVETETEDWVIKTLKLVISSHASIYADPPARRSALPESLAILLPPSPPNQLLEHVHKICVSTYFREPSANTALLPPAILSTLLLAALKLHPAQAALDWAHHLAEEWITELPDSFVSAISPAGQKRKVVSPEAKKRLESAKEGYLKLVELFVGEVLAREGEWEMARAFLDGEIVMNSKRKENLYRHLRSVESKVRGNSASPSNSGILPSPSASLVLPSSPSPNPQGHRNRSRSSSTSSSSSEATARPNSENRLTTTGPNGTIRRLAVPSMDRKGKNRAPMDMASESSNSTFPLPKEIHVYHPEEKKEKQASTGSTAQRPNLTLVHSLLSYLSPSMRTRIASLLGNRWLGYAVPLPLILLLVVLGLRRRRKRAVVMASPAAIGGAVAAVDAVDMVRDRLRQARERGLWQWLIWWFRWWVEKFAGVWKMGTTITYV